MRITEMTNLWVATCLSESFTILVVAIDKQEALEIAKEYFNESGIWFSTDDRIEIRELNICDKFDCDYVVTGGQ